MTEGLHSVILSVPINEVWAFVCDIERWAPLVPGYILHEIINDKTFLWDFKSEVGIMKKKIKLLVEIDEWQEPNKITFNIHGINQKLEGRGYFLAERVDIRQTQMTGYITITAKGAKAPIKNALLKTYVPHMTKEFAETIAKRLQVQTK